MKDYTKLSASEKEALVKKQANLLTTMKRLTEAVHSRASADYEMRFRISALQTKCLKPLTVWPAAADAASRVHAERFPALLWQ
mgnify:CR=1 FL=1